MIIRVDPRYFRPSEVETLLGDPTKAKDKLGWVPKIPAQVCAEMVANDVREPSVRSCCAIVGLKSPMRLKRLP